MRGKRFNSLRQRLGKRGILALIVVLLYAALAASTQLGVQVAGQGLDPVWAAAQQRGTLRVGTDFGYAPFTGMRSVTEQGVLREEPYGYDIDLARAIGGRLGLEIEFVPTSLESAYEALATGQADAIISALPYAPEQGWRATFSEFYFNAGQVLVVREDSPLADSGQLGGLRIGVALGSDADTLVRNAAASDPSLTLRDSYDTPAEAFADLRAGELDAVIADNAAALAELNRTPGLRFVPPALTLEPYAIAVSNRAFVLRDQINTALVALRTEGFFEQNGTMWFR